MYYAEGPRQLPDNLDNEKERVKVQEFANLLYQQGGPLAVALLDVLFDNASEDSVEFQMPKVSPDPDIRQWQIRDPIYINDNAVECRSDDDIRLEATVIPGMIPSRVEPDAETRASYGMIVYKQSDEQGGKLEFQILGDEVTLIVDAHSTELSRFHVGPEQLREVVLGRLGNLIPLRQKATRIGQYLEGARKIIADNQIGYFGEVSDSVAVVDDNEKNIDLASLKDSVTVADVAQIYGVTRQRVHALVRSGHLKPIQEISYPSGRTVRLFSRTDIESSRPARPANK